VYDVLNDPLGIYNDPGTVYRQIDYLSVPGQIVAKLRESTVRLPRYAAFAGAPYPLRLRFYTNGGVREYEFPAPPILEDHVETVFEAAERINRCKQLGASLLLRRYLELLWRPNPPPGGKVAQGWEVHVLGLQAGQKMTLWNARTGEVLVEAFANGSGRAEASLVLADEAQARALLVGLDDAPFRSRAEVRALSAQEAPAEGAARVAMRQTVLTPIAQTRSAAPIRSIGFVRDAGRARLELLTSEGSEPFRSQDVDRLIERGSVRGEAGVEAPAAGRTHWRGGSRRFTLLSEKAGRPEVVAEYTARAAADLSAAHGDLFVQADPDGHGVTAYRRGESIVVSGPQWDG
jgi:hypothetical protein